MGRAVFIISLFLGCGLICGKVRKDLDMSELFSEIENNETYKLQNELINNDYNSVLCWLETVNVVEYRNGSRTTDRQFSIILETPGDLSEDSVDPALPDPHTKKSKVLNFTTTHRNGNFSVKLNKTLVCGVGSVITKEYTRWPSDKKRIQINLASKKILDNYNLLELTNKKKTNKKVKRKPFSPEEIFNNKKQNRKTQTKAKFDVDNYNLDNFKTNIFKSVASAEETNQCDLLHKLNIKVQIITEHRIINKYTNEVIKSVPMTKAEKSQDFAIKLRNKPKSRVGENELNKVWERFAKMLSKEFFLEYYNRIIPFHELPANRINTTINKYEEFIIFDEVTQNELLTIQKYINQCQCDGKRC